MLEPIIENDLIDNLAGKFCRSPQQKNLLHESDSEIINLFENSGEYLAVTIDSIAEEIEAQLYDDPYLIGWMTVMVNLSDLAAVGAETVGLIISEILPENSSNYFIEKLQTGINDAVEKCKTFILGGDTNSGQGLILTGCALGKCPKNKILKRIGCKAGDILYSTGKLGRGNAYAISKLFGNRNSDFYYLPSARLKEALIIREFASICMDTSDGTISTLDQLMRLNNLGFYINENLENILEGESLKVTKSMGISPWLLLAGEHGEFELLFTIPSKVEIEFLKAADSDSWNPIRLGFVIEEPKIKLELNKKVTCINSQRIRNLPFLTRGNIELYLKKLLEYDNELIQSGIK